LPKTHNREHPQRNGDVGDRRLPVRACIGGRPPSFRNLKSKQKYLIFARVPRRGEPAG
jgi:hypothetical protein